VEIIGKLSVRRNAFLLILFVGGLQCLKPKGGGNGKNTHQHHTRMDKYNILGGFNRHRVPQFFFGTV